MMKLMASLDLTDARRPRFSKPQAGLADDRAQRLRLWL